MSWSPHMEFHCVNTSYPYNSAGSFMEYFEDLTYDHVNYIFAGTTQPQVNESLHPLINTSFYEYGISEPENTAYYGHSPAYEVNNVEPGLDEHRKPLDNSSTLPTEQPAAVHTEWDGSESNMAHENHLERTRRHRDNHDQQVVWQDNIDPDSMTYEELLELGETVGTQSRGLSLELISLLPISKYKCGFFSRKKSSHERCVICQMAYKRGDRRMTLPCKHIYHASCGTKWLAINKACPICFTEVFGDASKESRH